MTTGARPHLLCLGHGYSAEALARRLLAQGWQVTGTTRDPAKAAAMAARGITPLAWPLADLGPALAQASHVLVSVAPPNETPPAKTAPPPGHSADPAESLGPDPVLAAHGAALAQAAGHLRWLGYLSTTGVYGDHQGGWVDEDTPLTPGTARGHARLAAERAWQDLARQSGLALQIFRLAGIYGPGRGPFEKLREGLARRIIKPGQVFSRIHVEDIAGALAAAIAQAPGPGYRPQAVYNLCDDDPAPPEEVLGHAAELLGLPLPPAQSYADAAMTPLARSFYAESKRVSNARLKQALGYQLAYPTYRQGLAALLAEGG